MQSTPAVNFVFNGTVNVTMDSLKDISQLFESNGCPVEAKVKVEKEEVCNLHLPSTSCSTAQ